MVVQSTRSSKTTYKYDILLGVINMQDLADVNDRVLHVPWEVSRIFDALPESGPRLAMQLQSKHPQTQAKYPPFLKISMFSKSIIHGVD